MLSCFSFHKTMKDEKEIDEIISFRLNNRHFVLMLLLLVGEYREGKKIKKRPTREKGENVIVIQTDRCQTSKFD